MSLQIAIDNFNRANENPVTGWTKQPGSFDAQIVSNVLRPTVLDQSNNIFFNSAELYPDQFSQFTAITLTADTNLTKLKANLRASNVNETNYTVGLESSGGFGAGVAVTIGKFISGVYTQLGTSTTTVNSGDKIRAIIVGTLISVYLNGALQDTATDTAIAGGRIGVGLNAVTNLAFAELDDFMGGDFANSSYSEFPKPVIAEAVARGDLL